MLKHKLYGKVLSAVVMLSVFTTVFSMFPLNIKAEDKITVYLEEKVISKDAFPYLDADDNVMIPLRLICDSLEATLEWDAAAKTETIYYEEDVAAVTIGKKEFYLNDELYPMDAAAVIKDELVYAPLQFITKAMGLAAYWDAKAGTIKLTKAEDSQEFAIEIVDYGHGRIADFTTKDINGVEYNNDIFDEKPITFINYWATWCGPCRNELPDFPPMYEKYKDNVTFVTIIDDGKDNAAANSLVDTYLSDYINLLPTSALIKEIRSGYVPTSVIVGPGGYLIPVSTNRYNDSQVHMIGSFGDYSRFIDKALEMALEMVQE